MPKKPSVKNSDLSLLSVPAFWPMAMAAAMMEEGEELYAKNLKFVEEEIKINNELMPKLATPNQARLDLRTMVLRDYGAPGGLVEPLRCRAGEPGRSDLPPRSGVVRDPGR